MNSLWSRGAYFFEAVKGVGHPQQIPAAPQCLTNQCAVN
jgi:hypothetical protein